MTKRMLSNPLSTITKLFLFPCVTIKSPTIPSSFLSLSLHYGPNLSTIYYYYSRDSTKNFHANEHSHSHFATNELPLSITRFTHDALPSPHPHSSRQGSRNRRTRHPSPIEGVVNLNLQAPNGGCLFSDDHSSESSSWTRCLPKVTLTGRLETRRGLKSDIGDLETIVSDLFLPFSLFFLDSH